MSKLGYEALKGGWTYHSHPRRKLLVETDNIKVVGHGHKLVSLPLELMRVHREAAQQLGVGAPTGDLGDLCNQLTEALQTAAPMGRSEEQDANGCRIEGGQVAMAVMLVVAGGEYDCLLDHQAAETVSDPDKRPCLRQGLRNNVLGLRQ